MIPVRLFGPLPVDSTAELVFTGPATRKTLLESVLLQNPSGQATTQVRFAIGATGVVTAATTLAEYAVAAGPSMRTEYPRLVINAGEFLNWQSTVTDDQVVGAGSGFEY